MSNIEPQNRTWVFHLPNGEMVSIELPSRAEGDFATVIEKVMVGIEKAYPYLGFRPGIFTLLGDLVDEGTLKSVFATIVSSFSRDLKDYDPSELLARAGSRWGSNDLIPICHIRDTEGSHPFLSRYAAYTPIESHEDADASGWKVGLSPEMDSLSTVRDTGDPLTFANILTVFVLSLWWPPESYACIITQADIEVDS